MEEGRPRERASARARSPPTPVLRLRVRWSRLSLPCGASEERGRAESRFRDSALSLALREAAGRWGRFLPSSPLPPLPGGLSTLGAPISSLTRLESSRN